MTKRISLSIIACLILLSARLAANPGGETVTFGGASGWARLETLESLTTAPGRLGRTALVLDTSAPVSPDVDLLFTFDSISLLPGETDITGRYRIVSGDLQAVGASRAWRGSGAAAGIAGQKGLTLSGSPGSLFGGETETGSFTIEFWMRPATAENGTELFSWQSSISVSGTSRFQYIRAGISSNRMEWIFSNVWAHDGVGFPEVALRGDSNLIPGAWSHHALGWDESTGALSYRMNGMLESIRYLTDDGTENGSVYPSRFGRAAHVSIAANFAGILDEFAVLRTCRFPESPGDYRELLDRYSAARGRFVTEPIDTGGVNTILKAFSAEEFTPGASGTAYFVRASDSVWNWTADEPRWMAIESGADVPELRGRFFQVAGELYPDGNGRTTPTVTSVSLTYEKDSPPWPPLRVFAECGDASVNLTWKPSPDADAAGYLIYYGEHPGEYLSPGSPLDAGSALSASVRGLKNGRAYYFSVAAYDAAGSSAPGPLSVEVNARPRVAPAKAE